MSRWTVYILRCADGTLYTGITNDLARRVVKHDAGTGAKYTRSRGPVEVVWSRRVTSESAARKREAVIKKMTRERKMELVEKK
ncbi:GIY-YIG nuclease family protein [Patescibacteria group bacterium]|nr:GIY-YIG nuclease family protein [Patescibacteria group bacterium]